MAAMPLPIDYETDELAGRIIYQTGSGLISLGFHSSKFSNRDTSLTWQNAYTAFNGETEGRKGLAPDNEAVGWSLNGRYRFWDSTLTLSHRSTEMNQNEPFLPYTINASLTPADLPAASLNGEVKSTRTTLSFTRRLTRYLTVNIHGQVHERDNSTPILTMVPVLGDVFALESKQSRAYSFDFKRARIAFDYRLLYGTRLILGLQSDERKRTRSEIVENKEERYWLKFASNTFNGLRISLRYEDREREASPFQPVTNNNPLTVRYHQAARNQTSWRIDLDYEFRNSPYTISLNADAVTNDYPESTLGLQRDDDNRWGVNLSYQPSDRFSWRLSHQKQTSESEIFGSNAFSTRDWIYSTYGDVETTSVIIERKELFRNRLGLSLEYLHTDGSDGYNTEFDSISNVFPELVSKHRSLDFNALLRVRPGLVVKFRYYREEFDSADWALDQVTPITLTNVLGMGLVSPNYTISLASVSFVLSIGANL